MRRSGRREFLRRAGVSLAAATAAGRLARAAPAARDLPNIVFILADDMGYGDLNCQNPESKIPTPHLDRLAAESMRFTDAHAPTSVCTPTRYAILTGRYCWRSSLKRGVLWAWGRPLIEDGRLTVGGLLKRHGYRTGCVGKWHLGWDWRTADGEVVLGGGAGGGNVDRIDFRKPVAGGPLTKGFDYYFGTAVPNFPPYCFLENDRTVGIPTVPKPKTMFGHPGPMLPGWKLEEILPGLEAKAVEFVDRHVKAAPDRPFFLYFPLTGPHTPIAPTKEFQGKTKAGAYGDFVHQIDHHVGRLLAALKRSGVADNTLVIFTSDNGSPCRDGTAMSGPVGSVRRLGHDPSRPWRGLKSDAWDGGHRVPFLARWPGRIQAGAVSDEPICHVDFLATVAALLGEALPEDAGEDSHNLLPVLLGRPYRRPLREAIVHHSGNGMFAVRQGQWKLILGRGSGGFSKPSSVRPKPGEPKGQLYDLRADPAEQHNLWSERQDVVRRLTALLDKYKHAGRSVPRP